MSQFKIIKWIKSFSKNFIKIKFFLTVSIILSFITHTIDINSSNFIVARMTFSDVFGLMAIFLIGIDFFKKKLNWSVVPGLYFLSFIVIITFSLSYFTSLAPSSTISELLIVCYLVLFSITVYIAFKENPNQLINLIIITTCSMSCIGLYDLVIFNLGYQPIFDEATSNLGVSGFRYFGQAAHYSFIMLSILIPLNYSNLAEKFSKKKKNLLRFTIICGLIFMGTTGRISILISFIVGLFLFLIVKNEKRIWEHFVQVLGVVMLVGLFVNTIIPKNFEKVKYRIESRITNRVSGTPEASFFIKNNKDSVAAFLDNPFFGAGLGGFITNYSKFEIHGTYQKVLGETGLMGVLGYGIFLVFFIKLVTKKRNSIKNGFFGYYLPFFIASVVAWGYNYHFRKKEFWILIAFLLIIDNMESEQKRQQ